MDKFRTDLKIIRQVQSGEEIYIIKDPVALKYFRFSPLEVSVFRNLNGERSYDEVARMVTAETGVAVSGSHIAGYAGTMKKLNFIEVSASEKSLMLLEHMREERKRAAKVGSEGGDIFYQRFPLYDPDQLYNRLMKYIGFLWTREFFIFSLILFSLAATIIISNWEMVGAGLTQLRSFQSAGDVVKFIGVLFVVIIFHENGHGLTCKRFGGEVHEVGFMLIYFMPAFYANVSDAWTFQSKAAKLWVTFAGAFVELIISSIAAFVWYFSAPGYLTHEVAFTLMLVSGLSSILINMNPLIKLDGYFALVDYLEVPNLSEDASRYVSTLAKKYLFGSPVKLPDYKPRLKLIFLIYGLLSFFYRIFFLTVVIIFFYRTITGWFPDSGVYIFPFFAFMLLRKKLIPLWNGIRRGYVDKKELLMKPKSLVIGVSSLAVVLLLLFALPLPYWYETSFVIDPAERVPVRAVAPGFISGIVVREGESVRRGALLAVLRDPDLEQKRESLRAQTAVLDRRVLIERAQGDTAEALAIERRRAQLGNEIAEVDAHLQQLNLMAPIDGVVVTPKLEDRLGAMLKPGAEFCELAGSGVPKVRLTIDDWDLQDVEAGAPAALRFNALSGRKIDGRVTSIAPASEIHKRLTQAAAGEQNPVMINAGGPAVPTRKLSVREQEEAAASKANTPFEAPLTRYEVLIEMSGDTSEIKPGMSGQVKIYGPNRPLGIRIWRSVRNWFRSQIWW